ncbi:MAG TPA: hypothetical protein VGK82_08095 [Pyrinomonadaceae bacterium]
MSHPHKHFLIQAVILILWALTMSLVRDDVRVQAQITCPNLKYLKEPLPGWSWRQNRTVTVKIDDGWEEPDRAAIKDGNLKWNDFNCSGVEFTDFSEKTYTLAEYNTDPPDDTVYWQRIDPQNSGFGGGVFMKFDVSERILAARIKVHPTFRNSTSGTLYIWLGAHEVGHTFNLADCLCSNQCSCEGEVSVMSGQGSISFNSNVPKACDYDAVDQIYCPSPTPTPSPSPTPPQTESDCQNWGWEWNSFTSSCSPGGGFTSSCPDNCTPEMFSEPGQGGNSCVGPTDFCVYPSGGCESGYANAGNGCCCSSFNSPVLIDVNGNGFSLTSPENGVDFDINGDGVKERLSWTAPNSDDAWLVLDHSNNGRINSGRELFGNYTPQTRPPFGVPANGFIALAEYDKPANGGNGDGVINQSDSVFVRLRLWRDANHNGAAENTELHTLAELQVSTLELDYKESKHIDEYGNQFRYRAKVKNTQGQQMGRWAWDVFLVKKSL